MHPDPVELIDAGLAEPDAATHLARLRASAERLSELTSGESVAAERGSVEFPAYLGALAELGRIHGSREVLARAVVLTAEAMAHLDLLALLPPNAGDGIRVSEDEDPELRKAINDALLELADNPYLTGGVAVIEIKCKLRGATTARGGDPGARAG